MIVRGEGVAVGQPQELIGADGAGSTEEWVAATDQRQVVPATLDAVVEPQVGTRFRQARGVPTEEVLGAQGQLRAKGQAAGQLVARDEQFLGLGARHCQPLGDVQARLAITVAVGEGQDAFAPVLGMAAQLGAEQGFVTDLGAAKHEGIEDFRRRSVVVTVGITADMA
ncbi:hypothetical protein D9M71_248850 [compost metagenome]